MRLSGEVGQGIRQGSIETAEEALTITGKASARPKGGAERGTLVRLGAIDLLEPIEIDLAVTEMTRPCQGSEASQKISRCNTKGFTTLRLALTL